MTPKRIQAIRKRLGENTDTFGRRFYVSGRTIEDWEQGRRHPHPMVHAALKTLAKQVRR